MINTTILLLSLCVLQAFATTNLKAWDLFLKNELNASEKIFLKNTTHGSAVNQAEAFRGLAEIAGFRGERLKQTELTFKSYQKNKNLHALNASLLNLIFFEYSATGYTIDIGYDVLEEIAAQRNIHSGQPTDILIRRYIKDGTLKKAQALSDSLGVIQQWMHIGPFDNTSNGGYNKVYPPETEIAFKKTYLGKNGNLAQWNSLINREPQGWIFTKNHTYSYNAIHYFQTTLHSTTDQDVLLSFGASGSFKVMVNSTVVLADSLFRNTGIDAYMQNIHLHKGDNQVLIKLGHEQRQFSNFALRIFNTDFTPLNNVTISNKPGVTTENHSTHYTLNNSPLNDTILSYFDSQLAKAPHSLDAALLKINFLLGSDQTRESQILISTLLKQYPKSAHLHQLNYDALSRAGKHAEAGRALKECWRYSHENSIAWRYELGLVKKSNDFSKIIRFIDASTPILKNSVEGKLTTLAALYKLGKQTEALSIIEYLEKKHATAPAVLGVLIAIYLEQGNTRKIEELLLLSIKHNRVEGTPYKYLAELSLKQGDPNKAIQYFIENSQYAANNPTPYFAIANLYFLNKQYSEARVFIDKCLAVLPSGYSALNLKANILLALGDSTAAKRVLHTIIDFTDKDFLAWDHIRELEKKQSVSMLAQPTPMDSLHSAIQRWEHNDHSKGVVASHQTNIIRYPSSATLVKKHLVIYLPTQEAIDLWKKKTFSYNRNFQTVTIHKAVSYKPNGSETAAEINQNVAVFTSLEPGDYIVMDWTIHNYYTGTMAHQTYGEFSFFLSYPTYESEINFITPAHDTIPYTLYGKHIKRTQKKVDEYTITTLSKEPYKNPPFESYMGSDWAGNEKITYSTFSSWSAISNWYYDVTQDKLNHTLELEAIADSLFAGLKSDDEKIEAVHSYITDVIRYSSIPFRQSGWIPQAAKEVVSTKIGDCKDMAALGKSLLALAKIPADLVLVNTYEKQLLDRAYIGPNFNHCILATTYKGKKHFIDFTDNNQSIEGLPLSDQGAMALLIKRDNSILFNLPIDTPEERSKTREVHTTLHEDGSMHRTSTTVRKGVFSSSFRSSYRFATPEDNNTEMHEILSHAYPDVSLASFSHDDLNTLNDTINYTTEYTAKNAVLITGKTGIFPLNMADIITPRNFPIEEKRVYPIDLQHSWANVSLQNQSGSITFPKTWKLISLPESVSHTSPYGTYSLTFTQQDTIITYARSARLTIQGLIPANQHKDIAQFYRKMVAADEVQLLFFTR